MRHVKWFALAALVGALLLAFGTAPAQVTAQAPKHNAKVRVSNDGSARIDCGANSAFCTEAADSVGYEGAYTGHDEPSLLFYDKRKGSGNSSLYYLRLPNDPPQKPKQDGSGGTWNFQLHPAFWLGMAMCDSQSDPNYTNVCNPDTDANIFDNTTDPNAPDYIGKHPGTAFMEMQFYPPGWVPWPAGVSCDAKQWCAALNIDSLSDNGATGQPNNNACIEAAGEEYVNFAFITKSGVAHAPASPLLSTAATYTPNKNKDLFMNSGDLLKVDIHDTSKGLTVIIDDLTSGAHGSMTASIANHFGQVLFDPNGSTCAASDHNLPYAFHPLYATSSEHTRVTWTAHTYNVSYSDEIGHFELCNAVDSDGNCTTAGGNDPGGIDDDDNTCFPASASLVVKVTGCIGTEDDFDGASYGLTWPGTLKNAANDAKVHPDPIMFTSPLFTHKHKSMNFQRAGFEVDMPRIERPTDSPNNNCDKTTGAGCVNPPVGATFYPLFSTRTQDGGCWWQEGGDHIPGTVNDFGGTSVTEFGTTPFLVGYEGFGRYNDFQNILSKNPCRAAGGK